MNKPFNGLTDHKRCKKCRALGVVDTDNNGYYIVKCSSALCGNTTSGTEYSSESILEWDINNNVLNGNETNFEKITQSPEALAEFILKQYGYSQVKIEGNYYNMKQWLTWDEETI
jgi:hypothetical protein